MPEWVDFLIMLGAIVLVTLAALLWALSLHKSGKRQRKHHHHRKSHREQFQKGAGDIKELVRQRRGGRHRGHRHTNPTLAETGGLPPLREAEQPPPPSPQL